MEIAFSNYRGKMHDGDYARVREFLIDINQERLVSPNFTWGRWEWMMTHKELDRSQLFKIGLWERGGSLVALATYETKIGSAYLCVKEGFEHLKPEMLDYASVSLRFNGKLRVLIADSDRATQIAAAKRGFRASQGFECVSAFDLDGTLEYSLPEGFQIISMAQGWDYMGYNSVMSRGFGGNIAPPDGETALRMRRQMLSSPAINPELVLAVIAPDGGYAAHCGVWHFPGCEYAYIEPVATDPDFRKMGMGKAVVYEACRRAAAQGAKRALVCSSQQFYYAIGFYPFWTETWWEK